MVLEKALASCTTFMELEMGFTFATVFLFKEKKIIKKSMHGAWIMNISNLFHFVISNFMMGVRPAAINDI
jgi:hypothetical protein